jgi:hypothetical protein
LANEIHAGLYLSPEREREVAVNFTIAVMVICFALSLVVLGTGLDIDDL